MNEHDSATFLQNLLDSTSEGIWGIGPDGLITYANKSAVRIFGFDSAADLIGKSSHALVHHSFPDGRPYPPEECPISRANDAGEAISLDNEIMWRADGTSFFANYRLEPVIQNGKKIGAVISVTDNTEKRRIQAELEKNRAERADALTRLLDEQVLSRRQVERAANDLAIEKDRVWVERHLLESIFQQSPAAMALWTGPDLVFDKLNPAYQGIFPGRHLEGLPLKLALPELDEQGFPDLLLNVLETGKTFIGNEVLSRIRPTPESELEDHYYDFAYVQIRDPHGRPYAVYDHAIDVTDRVLARRDLEKAKLEAERANETKSAFLANMSHEIRTPLAAIDGFTDLLKNEATSPEERGRFLDTISRNTKALARIIDDILDLAKVEAGKLETENVEFSLRGLINEVADLFAEMSQSKQIYLRSNFGDGLPERIISDPTRLRQILINLVGNAVKFTNTGGVTISVNHRGLSPTSAFGLQQFSIDIADTGIGINAAEQERLFQPFMQADNTTTRKFGGTGLGLALSRRLAIALGGDVSIRNCDVGTGSTFVVLFNAQPTASVEKRQIVKNSAVNTSANALLTGLSILVADDSIDNQYLVQRMLSKQGALIDTASNGREAVDQAMKKEYDAILMDIQMPEMDGYAATRALRNAGYKKPIIALTAHAMSEERNRTREAGCDGHLTKPLDRTELVRTIVSLASRRS